MNNYLKERIAEKKNDIKIKKELLEMDELDLKLYEKELAALEGGGK